jgi:hypothetical protein
MPKSDDELSKQKAFDQFRRRRLYAAQIEKVDNAELHGGAPMYFYCRYCGVPAEVLPEDYLFPPLRVCSQCEGLKTAGFLEEAMASG